MKDTLDKLSTPTIALHWLVGVVIVFMIPVAIYMADYEVFFLYPIHKSIGVTLFVFIIARVVWRVINGWPKPVSEYQKWEQILAKIVHWVLIVGTVLLPISGMTMSGAGGYGIPWFGLELMAMNVDPNDVTVVLPINELAAEIGHEIHHLLAIVMSVSILLHIAGALKHHFIDKDKTLQRMVGKSV
ncbi:MAG: cytochrome b [Pseudomonadales bacterium]|nr:cytochrome b [Pseudomonadales bacterium]